MTEQRAPLTPAERADLRQKAEEATPGPWEHVPFSDEVIEAADREHTQIATSNDSVADAAYIAAISPDRLLALLDEVERLEEKIRLAHLDGVTERACWHGHKTRQVGCVSCSIIFDLGDEP